MTHPGPEVRPRAQKPRSASPQPGWPWPSMSISSLGLNFLICQMGSPAPHLCLRITRRAGEASVLPRPRHALRTGLPTDALQPPSSPRAHISKQFVRGRDERGCREVEGGCVSCLKGRRDIRQEGHLSRGSGERSLGGALPRGPPSGPRLATASLPVVRGASKSVRKGGGWLSNKSVHFPWGARRWEGEKEGAVPTPPRRSTLRGWGSPGQ